MTKIKGVVEKVKIQIEVEIPNGKFCNNPCQTGCQFLDGIARIGRCFCKLFREYLNNTSDDYTMCDANLKCEQCLKKNEDK
jgi:hypothetical protein